MVARTEVMDLDEEVYRKGEWKVRMYGEAFTPASPRWMQGAKEQVQRESEEETLEAMAMHVASLVEEDEDLMIVWVVAEHSDKSVERMDSIQHY